MRKGKELDYWETLDRDADQKFEELTQQCLNGELTVDQMWNELSKVQYDYPDSDITKEPLNKVFDFIAENRLMSDDDALKSYRKNYYDCRRIF
jgi:hypothetical protein